MAEGNRFCGNCGRPLVANARFCGSCGTAVPAAAPAATNSDPPPSRKRRGRGPLVVLVVLVLAAAGLGAYLLLNRGQQTVVEEGVVQAGDLSCGPQSTFDAAEDARFGGDDGATALVVIRSDADVVLEIWGDIDQLDEIREANPDATSAECRAVFGTFDDAPGGEPEVGIVEIAGGGGFNLYVGGPPGATAGYQVVIAKDVDTACERADAEGFIDQSTVPACDR